MSVNNVKGSVTIRRADGTNYASPESINLYIPFPEDTLSTMFSHQIVNPPAQSAGTLTLNIPATCRGLCIKSLAASGEGNLNISFSAGGSKSVQLRPGQVFLITHDDLDNITIGREVGSDPDFLVEVVLWGTGTST